MDQDFREIKALLESGAGSQLKRFLEEQADELNKISKINFGSLPMAERGKLVMAHKLAYNVLKDILSQILIWKGSKKGRKGKHPKDRFYNT